MHVPMQRGRGRGWGFVRCIPVTGRRSLEVCLGVLRAIGPAWPSTIRGGSAPEGPMWGAPGRTQWALVVLLLACVPLAAGLVPGLLLPPHHPAWRVPPPGASPSYRFWGLEEMVANQFPKSCAGRRFVLKHMDTPGGMWAQIRELSGLLGLALALNRTLVVSDSPRHPWRYAPPLVATDAEGVYRPWAYWFEPLTNCSVPAAARPERVVRGCPSEHSTALVVEAAARDCYKSFAPPYPSNWRQVWRNALLGMRGRGGRGAGAAVQEAPRGDSSPGGGGVHTHCTAKNADLRPNAAS